MKKRTAFLRKKSLQCLFKIRHSSKSRLLALKLYLQGVRFKRFALYSGGLANGWILKGGWSYHRKDLLQTRLPIVFQAFVSPIWDYWFCDVFSPNKSYLLLLNISYIYNVWYQGLSKHQEVSSTPMTKVTKLIVVLWDLFGAKKIWPWKINTNRS